MKQTTIIICLCFLSFLTNAQPGPFPPERMSDDEIISMQTRDIVCWMGLDGKTKDQFVKEYTAFRKEIDAIAKNARPPQDIKQEIKSESEIDKAIRQNFEVSEQILQVRKKYYARYKEFLKPSQIQMLYRIEKEAGRRMYGGPGGPERQGGPDGPGGHGDHPMPPHYVGDRPDC